MKVVSYPVAQAKHTASARPSYVVRVAAAEIGLYSSTSRAGSDMQRGALVMLLDRIPAHARLLYGFTLKQFQTNSIKKLLSG